MIDPRIDASTPVVIQGITGRAGRLHTRLMRAYGTNIVAGVSPKGGIDEVAGVPIFTSCADAVQATGATAAVTFVPPLGLCAAMEEGVAAGLKLIVTPTEGVPVHDALSVLRCVREAGVLWIGGSTPGMAVAGEAKLGFLPEVALAPGPVGLISKSGTLSYEVGYRLAMRGLGTSVWIGVGGDPVKGTRFADLVPFFHADQATGALAVIGEIGGTEEEEFAQALEDHGFAKPVSVLIAGRSAPEGVTMGHAGALAHGNFGTFETKRAALEAAGARVFQTIDALIDALDRDIGGQQ